MSVQSLKSQFYYNEKSLLSTHKCTNPVLNASIKVPTMIASKKKVLIFSFEAAAGTLTKVISECIVEEFLCFE